jgi:hypothetical protein
VNDDPSDSLYYYPAVAYYSFSARTHNEQRALEPGHIQQKRRDLSRTSCACCSRQAWQCPDFGSFIWHSKNAVVKFCSTFSFNAHVVSSFLAQYASFIAAVCVSFQRLSAMIAEVVVKRWIRRQKSCRMCFSYISDQTHTQRACMRNSSKGSKSPSLRLIVHYRVCQALFISKQMCENRISSCRVTETMGYIGSDAAAEN